MTKTEEDIKEARKNRNREYYAKNTLKMRENSRRSYENRREARKLTYTPGSKDAIKVIVVDIKSEEAFEYPSKASCVADMGFTLYKINKNLKDRIPFDGYMIETELIK